MSDISKLYTFYEAMEDVLPGENPRAQRKKLFHMQSLAVDIFRLSMVKHNDMDEAITAVYLTGLYHAVMIGKEKPDAKA